MYSWDEGDKKRECIQSDHVDKWEGYEKITLRWI
jgi:hypothetical protein